MNRGLGFRTMKVKLVCYGILSRTDWGVTLGIKMHFELRNLITPRGNLQNLVEPWSHSEIDNIVKKMPTDKALGPDGFMASS